MKAVALVLLNDFVQFFFGVAYAGEVGHHRVLVNVFEGTGIVQGAASGAASGSVGDGDKIGAELSECSGGCFELSDGFF